MDVFHQAFHEDDAYDRDCTALKVNYVMLALDYFVITVITDTRLACKDYRRAACHSLASALVPLTVRHDQEIKVIC